MLFVAGLDEVGRGPLAGPVTAGCVVFRPGYQNDELTDSKKLSAEDRERLAEEIVENSLAFATVSVGPRRIEQLNILGATKAAMCICVRRVYAQLRNQFGLEPELYLLIDGNFSLETPFAGEAIIKGDEKIKLISAASIIAKVARDSLMSRLDSHYPGYGFAQHKGYATAQHRKAVEELGPSCIHRRTFSPISDRLQLELL